MHPAIELDGLTKDYGDHRALDHVTLRVERGEIFGFLGPNGAGKSTTIRLLLDLIRPTAGSARIMDKDCQRQSCEARSFTGYLAGDLRLYPGLHGRETVELIASLRKPGAHGVDLDQRYLAQLAGELQFDLDKPVGDYSKGTRQKLGLVLALIDHPPVLLLDEPTSGLDPIMQKVALDLLRDAAATGATVFCSSHVMSEVEHFCQRVAVLREGRLVAVESIAELKSRTLRRLEVTFAGSPPPPDAFALPGIHELSRDRSSVWLQAQGHLAPLLKALAGYDVADLRTEQPGLDEILLTFYRDGGAGRGGGLAGHTNEAPG